MSVYVYVYLYKMCIRCICVRYKRYVLCVYTYMYLSSKMAYISNKTV